MAERESAKAVELVYPQTCSKCRHICAVLFTTSTWNCQMECVCVCVYTAHIDADIYLPLCACVDARGFHLPPINPSPHFSGYLAPFPTSFPPSTGVISLILFPLLSSVLLPYLHSINVELHTHTTVDEFLVRHYYWNSVLV